MSVHRTVENVYIRQRSVQRTRQYFWSLLGMTVIIRLVTDVLNWVLYAIGDGLMIPEINSVIDQYALLVTSTKMTSTEPMLNALTELFMSPKFILFNLVYMVLTSIVAAGLSLGRCKQLIEAGRGIRPQPLGVFGGMKRCPKAWGLQLWTGLKIGLWLLPGLSLVVIQALLIYAGQGEIGEIVAILGLALLLTLGIRALLRYAMAPYLLADEPAHSIRDCVETSTELMKGRLWQFFKVRIPVFFKFFGAYLLGGIVFSMVEMIIPMNLQIAAALETILLFAATAYFSEQLALVNAVFYLNILLPVTPENAPKPVSEWLNTYMETDIAPDEPERPDTEADMPPEDTPQTNEAKETDHEEPER